MSDPIDYAKEYDNSGRVPDSAVLIENYISDGAQYREREDVDKDLDLSYGPEPRNRVDLFWPDTEEGKARKSPIVLFIHGGYWQRLDRMAFSHLSQGLTARGIAVAMPSYTLCPDIEIAGIITEMRRACLILYQTYRNKLTVIGHSAGGHLAACMLATDWKKLNDGLPNDLVAAGLGISGLYDLVPLLQTPVNDAVQMDEEQAIAASPVLWIPEALKQFDAWVGGDESNEYHRQSKDLARKWSMLGTPTRYVSDPGTNHFTIINALKEADSPLVERIVELVENPDYEANLPEPDEADIQAVLNPEDTPKVKEEKQETPEQTVKKSVSAKINTEKRPRRVAKNKRVIIRKKGSRTASRSNAPIRKKSLVASKKAALATKRKPQKRAHANKAKAAAKKKA